MGVYIVRHNIQVVYFKKTREKNNEIGRVTIQIRTRRQPNSCWKHYCLSCHAELKDLGFYLYSFLHLKVLAKLRVAQRQSFLHFCDCVNFNRSTKAGNISGNRLSYIGPIMEFTHCQVSLSRKGFKVRIPVFPLCKLGKQSESAYLHFR